MGQEKSDADAEILSTHLCSYSLDNSWEIMVLPLTMLHPGSEITHFAIVTRVCEPHFGPDQEDLSVVDDHPAIVDDIFVDDRPDKVVSMVHRCQNQKLVHAHVADNICCFRRTKDLGQDFPRMEDRVPCATSSMPARRASTLYFTFQKMIKTAISTLKTGCEKTTGGSQIKNRTYGISSSGPTRRVAPRLFAIAILSRILLRLPWDLVNQLPHIVVSVVRTAKSRAH